MSNADEPILDATTETTLAKKLFNGVWALLEKPDRTPADDDALVHMAHAARHHWTREGTPQNLAIGEWQVARIYAELGRGEPAVHHSKRCLAHAETGVDAWCLASAQESMARSLAVAGDRTAASGWKAKAIASLDAIADPDDRELIQRDIDSLPPVTELTGAELGKH